MVKIEKATSLPVEYCAFMVAIMLSRYIIDVRKPNVQQSPEKIAENLNSLEFGLKGNFYVTAVALHHGLFIFKRALQSMGYEIIEMHGKEKQLVDFFTLSSGKRGYDVKFPLLDGVSLPLDYTEETLNNVVLANRDLLLSMGNFMKSKFFSCSSLFLDLFVDIQTLVKQKDQTQASFLSPVTDVKRSIFKVRKPIDDLSDRSIKNNGKRVLEYVESLYGEEDAELYITAAYGTPELRILSYLEEEEAEKKYDKEVFVNDGNVDENLRECIEKLEKRWRAVGENFGFHGTSRERSLLCRAVKDVRRMSTFYSKVSKVQDVVSLSEEITTCSLLLKKESMIESPVYKCNILESMEQLKPLVANSRASSAPCNAKKPWEISRARAVLKYYTLLLEDVGKLAGVGFLSETALAFYPMKGREISAVVRSAESAKTCYKARSAREWGEEYLITGEFPEFKQGEHAKTFSIIDNEMNRAELTSQLRSWSDVDRKPEILMKRSYMGYYRR